MKIYIVKDIIKIYGKSFNTIKNFTSKKMENL